MVSGDGNHHAGANGERFVAWHICYQCVAVRDGIEEGDVLKNLTQHRSEKNAKRAFDYKEGLKVIRAFEVWAADVIDPNQCNDESKLVVVCNHCNRVISRLEEGEEPEHSSIEYVKNWLACSACEKNSCGHNCAKPCWFGEPHGAGVARAALVQIEAPTFDEKAVAATTKRKAAVADGKGVSSCETAPDPDARPSGRKQRKKMRMQVLANMSRLATLFTPYFNLIQAKRGDEDDQVRAAEAFTKWYNSGSMEDLESLCKQGWELEEKLQDAARKQRAFESKGEEQGLWMNAADYADNWVDDNKGEPVQRLLHLSRGRC